MVDSALLVHEYDGTPRYDGYSGCVHETFKDLVPFKDLPPKVYSKTRTNIDLFLKIL